MSPVVLIIQNAKFKFKNRRHTLPQIAVKIFKLILRTTWSIKQQILDKIIKNLSKSNSYGNMKFKCLRESRILSANLA